MLKTVSALSKSSPSIAVIGCGAITEWFYLPALTRHPSVLQKLILVDRDEGRAQELARQFNVQRYLVDYHEALDEVDGAIIAVPTQFHHPIAMDFLRQGIPILCEKPLAETAVKAREMVAQAQKSGAALATNYTRRLYASFRKVKELLTDGTLGEPLVIKYFVGEEFRWPTKSGFYFNTKTSPRGVLLDRGAHVIDLICWWLEAKPTLVSCQNDSFGGIDAVTHVKFEHHQCLGEVRLSWLGNSLCRYLVQGEAGTIEGDIYDFRNVTLTTKTGQSRKIALKSSEKYDKDFRYKQVQNFIDVLSGKASPYVSGQDVLNSVEFIDECYETASRFEMPWYQIPVTTYDR